MRFFLFLFSLLFFSCTENHELKLKGEAQGTTYSIVYVDSEGKNFKTSVDSIFLAVDNSVSTYKSNSIISKINRNEKAETDEIFERIFEKSLKISEATDGAFDVTVAPLVNAWGFGWKKKNFPDSSQVDSLKKLVNYKNVQIINHTLVKNDSLIQIDFNAIAPGFTVDLIAEFLEERNIQNYMIELGGEVRAKGKNLKGMLWRIGIDEPLENSEGRPLAAILKLENKSLATSGNYRKFYIQDGKKFSHTIDPSTGFPVQHNLLSASVMADDCTTADAYATAFMVMGLEKTKMFLEKNKQLEVFLIYSDEGENLRHFKTQGFAEAIVEESE